MEIEENYRIKKFEDESDNTYQLRIAALKLEDAGEYECVVANMLGEARMKGKITVKCKLIEHSRHANIPSQGLIANTFQLVFRSCMALFYFLL
jgi:hypothetical protein